MVCVLDPQIIGAAQSMKHPLLPALISDRSGSFASKVDNLDSLLTQYEKVFGWQEKAFDRGLVQLKTLVPEAHEFRFTIKDEHVVGVAPSSLVANHQVLLSFVLVIDILQKVQVHLPNGGLICPIYHVRCFFPGVLYLNS